MKKLRSKKALLARIGNGPTAVQLIANTSHFRVSVPEDRDPNGGVWISLVTDAYYMVDDYDTVYARVAGKHFRLTRAESDMVARYVARKMRGRAPKPVVRARTA